MAAAKTILDKVYEDLPIPSYDHNAYILGRVGKHNMVVAGLPNGKYGTTSAAVLATQLLATFHSICFGLMVGVGRGVPNNDVEIRLGDVMVSKPTNRYRGVVQYDYGKALSSRFQQTGALN
jgi:nucleoside phosphorylase